VITQRDMHVLLTAEDIGLRSLSKVGQRALDDNSPASKEAAQGLSRCRFAAASYAPTAQNQKHSLLRFPSDDCV